MKKRLKALLLLIICCSTLSGCWDQRIYERVGLILTTGIEEAEDGKLLLNYIYPIIDTNQKSGAGIVSTEASLLRGGRENTRMTQPKYMEGGKIQQVLIADSLAKKGIHDVLEIFQRDVAVPAIAYVAIVEGSPSELIKKASEFKNVPRVSFYLFQLIDNNVQISNIPNTKVFDFDINFFAPGLDPIVPMIKLESEFIEIIGSALFSGDKMVGKLNQKQTLMLIGLMGQAKNTDYVISDPKLNSGNPDKYGLATMLRKPKRKINIDFNEDGIPIINISMKYDCILDEYRWNKTSDLKEQQRLEAIIADHIEKSLTETIKLLQEASSDPIGFGDMIRAKYNSYWKSVEWKEIYPEAKISVKVKVDIIKEGLIK